MHSLLVQGPRDWTSTGSFWPCRWPSSFLLQHGSPLSFRIESGAGGRPQRSSRIPFSLTVTMAGLSPAVRTGFPVGGVQEDLEDFSHSFNEPPAC